MSRINLDVIQKAFPQLNCEWVESIESTQRSVKANGLLIAEEQTSGVGRRGNHWLSPKGRSICLSYRVSLPLDTKEFAGYQITTALAIMCTVQKFEPKAPIKLKWPNDLFVHDKKFAGILINLIPTTNNHTDIIIGIGINWRLDHDQLASVNRPISNTPIKTPPKRNAFIIELIQTINNYNDQFIQYGLSHFLGAWQKHDYLTGKRVNLVGDKLNVTGLYDGLNPKGELLIKTSTGIKHFSSGEVSVKPV